VNTKGYSGNVDQTPGVRCTDRSDGDLMNAIALRDEDAFAEVFHRHSASVTAASAMILGRDGRCDDVVAEVFFALWISPQLFDPGRGTLLGFLRLKAKGRSIDVVRSEMAARRRDQNNAADCPPDSDVVAHFLSAERAALMRSALDSLPDPQRIPIQLAFFEGKTYAAVARQLGLPEGTVKSRIRNGLQQLRMCREVETYSTQVGAAGNASSRDRESDE
jgi:RNA polymerase sigma-70 factor (ECF subfamily)